MKRIVLAALVVAVPFTALFGWVSKEIACDNAIGQVKSLSLQVAVDRLYPIDTAAAKVNRAKEADNIAFIAKWCDAEQAQ